MTDLWPNQVRAVNGVNAARAAGLQSVCVEAPTGGGKTRVIATLADQESAKVGGRTVLFTNRRLLTAQAGKTMAALGVRHGYMAANYDFDQLQSRVHVCSFQTIDARVFEQGRWKLPPATLCLIDEAHSNKGASGRRVIGHYRERGAFTCGFSATPVDLEGLYQKLVNGGTKKELRAQGKLVPCHVFAPDEPGVKGVRRVAVDAGDVWDDESERKAAKRLMSTIVFANVFDHWKAINPAGLPTILFAPGVPESRWFVEQWKKLGVRAAHIDADTPDEEREQIFKDNEIGYCPVICSQGVLREGVDLPWLYHGILCQPCLNVSTYLQVVGRLLRAYEGKTKCILQDHAGAFWRHGSPNADRVWRLGDTNQSIRRERKARMQGGDEPEPIRCPKCAGIRIKGPKCPHCGHEHVRTVRMVRMTDGNLEAVGRATKVKREQTDQDVWKSCLFAAANGRTVMTFRQAAFLFQKKTGRAVHAGLSLVPSRPSDNGRLNIEWDGYVTAVYPWLKRKTARRVG